MTLEQLSWYIDNTIAKRLLGLPGVAAVSRVGGVSRNIRVILDPAALQAQGITAAQVNAAASPKQHERRRRPGRDRRLRTVGARARQCPGRLSAVADADHACRAAAS